jgi:hypothetical protein
MGVVYNRSLNIFTGVVNSNFSDVRNWSGRYVPTASDAAFINANCTFDINRTLGALIVNPGVTASISSGRTLIVTGSVNVQGHLSASGNPNIYFRGAKNIINSFSPGTSTVFYDAGYDQVVAKGPYHSLTIAGSSLTNTKTPSSNLVVSGNLRVTAFSTFELGRYDIDVIGTTTLFGQGQTLRKSSGGNIIFRGNVIIGPASTNNTTIDFSGNPTVEVQSGFNHGDGFLVFNAGIGTWYLTTNNQVVRSFSSNTTQLNFYGPVIISGSISASIQTNPVAFFNSINGTNANSKLYVESGYAYLGYSGSYMQTGIFDFTSSINGGVGFIYSGSGILPYTTFQNLILANYGVKSLVNNTTVNNLSFSQWTNAPRYAELELGNYDLTVSGSTSFFGYGGIYKSGPGKITYGGLVYLNASSAGFKYDYSGNPTVEYKAGMGTNDNYSALSNSGTGSWIFSTSPNQNIDLGTPNFSASILISGSVTLNLVRPPSVFIGTINGTTTESIFSIPASTTFTYRNAQQPMLTGSLYASASANTVVYSLSGSQFIATPSGSIYRNLTLAGSGSKTLTGNVSVQNTFTTSSLITLVTGSYTLTNP